MPLNHTFSIALCNTKLILKLGLLIIILFLIAFAVLSSVTMPFISDIVEIINNVEVEAKDFINHPVITLRTQFIDKIIVYLKNINLCGAIGAIIGVYFCFNFFIIIPQLPLTKVLYNKMTSGYDIGLFNTFIATGFQNILLSFLLSIITSAFNLGVFAGVISLGKVCFDAKAFISLPFVIILSIVLLSLKGCLLSQIMPEICASQNKNIFVGMKNAIKGTFVKFRKNFLCFFTLNFIWFAIWTSTFIPTLGAFTLISMPCFVVMRSILSLTLNFSYHQHKYFVDNGTTIYTPTKVF